MKRFLTVAAILFAVFSGLFIWFEQSGWLTAPVVRGWMTELQGSPWGGIAVAGAVFALLLVDIVLPIPSSVVMTLAGAILGIWGGVLASFAGAMGAALTAFWACRLGGRTVFGRLSGGKDSKRAEDWFERYGVYAIVLSRPVPMLTEVLSCLAGLSGMRARLFAAATALGTLPVCLVYSAAGHYGTITNPWPAVLVALGIPAAGWAVLRWVEARGQADAESAARNARCGVRTRLHAWGELLRLPNLFTVPGDVLAGFLLGVYPAAAFGGWPRGAGSFGALPWPDLGVMIAGVLAVYLGGLVLNDVFDVKIDRVERPARPLPSGRIRRPTAAWVGVGLLAAGPVLALALTGIEAGSMLALVAVFAIVYDAAKSRSAATGVILMGLCRGGAVLCGALAAGTFALQNPFVWGAAGGAFVYTALVTGLALGETRRERPSGSTWLLPAVLLGLAVLTGGLLSLSDARLWPGLIFVLAAGESAWAVQRVRFGALAIPAFIGQSIRIMITMQCAWCAAAYTLHRAAEPASSPQHALLILLLVFALLRMAAEFASQRYYGS